MTNDELNGLLGGWEGYELGRVQRIEQKDRCQIRIYLACRQGWPLKCSGCGERTLCVHDTEDRWVRDQPILDAETLLCVPRRRVACPRSGPKLEALSWLARYARVTRRLADSVVRLCRVLPVKHVTEYLGLGWNVVKSIDKSHLQESLGEVDLSNLEEIAMDEFAIQKGHRYATVIVQPQTKRVLWIGRGRGREDVRPFFEQLGEQGRRQLQAVAMDMNAAYEEEVRYQCPTAQVVYDLFHVVAKYGREVIDRVRVDEANKLRDNKPARKVIKGSRWLLLRNRENVPSE